MRLERAHISGRAENVEFHTQYLLDYYKQSGNAIARGAWYFYDG